MCWFKCKKCLCPQKAIKWSYIKEKNAVKHVNTPFRELIPHFLTTKNLCEKDKDYITFFLLSLPTPNNEE